MVQILQMVENKQSKFQQVLGQVHLTVSEDIHGMLWAAGRNGTHASQRHLAIHCNRESVHLLNKKMLNT